MKFTGKWFSKPALGPLGLHQQGSRACRNDDQLHTDTAGYRSTTTSSTALRFEFGAEPAVRVISFAWVFEGTQLKAWIWACALKCEWKKGACNNIVLQGYTPRKTRKADPCTSRGQTIPVSCTETTGFSMHKSTYPRLRPLLLVGRAVDDAFGVLKFLTFSSVAMPAPPF